MPSTVSRKPFRLEKTLPVESPWEAELSKRYLFDFAELNIFCLNGFMEIKFTKVINCIKGFYIMKIKMFESVKAE